MFWYQNIEQIYTITCSKLLKKQSERIFSSKNFQNLKETETVIASEPKEQITHSFLHVNNIFHYFALSSLPMWEPGNFHMENSLEVSHSQTDSRKKKHSFQVSVRLRDLKRLNTQQIHSALTLSLKAPSHLSLLFGCFFCFAFVLFLFMIYFLRFSSIYYFHYL